MVTLGAQELVPEFLRKMALCSHFEYPICDCVHSYSMHFAPSDAILKHEPSSENKAVDCPELTKIVFSQGPGAHALVQGRDLVLGHRHRARILAYLKKGCVHISAQRVPYLGTRPGHQM